MRVSYRSLECLYETDYIWALIYAVGVYQVCCAVGTVDFVAFLCFLVAFAALF